MSEAPASRSRSLPIGCLLAIVCLLTRLAVLGRWPEAWDSINFVLALREFDVAAGQPHFPGYPVYVLAGRALLPLTGEPVTALILAACIGSSLALWPLYRLTRRLFGEHAAIATGLLAIANPFLFLEAEKLFSDAFSLLFLALMADRTHEAVSTSETNPAGARRAGYLAGLAGGVLLGVRLSALPLVVAASLWILFSARASARRRPAWAALHGIVHGVGAWLIPLLLLTGPRELWQAGQEHLAGHFGEWGGSAATSPGWGGRLRDFAWCLGANGLGVWWPDAPAWRLVATLCLPAALAAGFPCWWRSSGAAYLALLVLPYAVWVLAGQNLENPRHVLPLVLLVLPVIGAGAGRARWPLVALAVAWSVTAVPLLLENRARPPTRVQLVRFLQREYRRPWPAIVCWNSARFFDWAAPEASDRVVGSIEEAVAIAGTGGEILVVSDLPTMHDLRRRVRLEPVQTFRRDRYVHNALHRLTLYRVERGASRR